VPSSYWQTQSFLQKADITIIGAGFTGLFSALFLKEKYPRSIIRVLEQGPYPDGASARNAGFACFGSPSELLDDIETEGEVSALTRLKHRFQGLKLLREIVGDNYIDYQPNDGFEVFTENELQLYEKCIEQLKELNQKAEVHLGYAPFQSEATIPTQFSGVKALIRIKGEATIGTGQLLKRLIKLTQEKAIELHFNCSVRSYSYADDHLQVETGYGKMKTDKLVFATNAYSHTFFPDLPLKPGRGQVLMTQPIAGLNLRGSYHLERGYYYLRAIDNRIMLGGGRHLDYQGESTTTEALNPVIQTELEALLKRLFPKLPIKIDMRWSGIMAFGPNNEKEPIIARRGKNVWIAARLGGMGVAMAPMVAKKLTALV